MRIYADNIVNTQATIEANNNLWIQKDVEDTRSNSLKNISGTIKTNTGNLLIRADSVENRPEFIINSSEKINQVGDRVYMKKFISEMAPKSLLSTGNNLYINSGQLNNELSNIISKNDMFLTGGTFINKNWYNYSIDYYIPSKRSLSYFLDVMQLDGSKFILTSELAELVKSGKSLIADFSNDIILTANSYTEDKTYFSDIDSLFFYNTAVRPTTVFANKDIVLQANDINVGQHIKSQSNISLLAKNSIQVKNSEISTNKDINLIAINNLILNQSKLDADHLALITRSGNVKTKPIDNVNFFESNGNQIFSKLLAKKKLDIEAGNNIELQDLEITVGLDLALNSGKNITLKNTNKSLIKLIQSGRSISESEKIYSIESFNKTRNINIMGNATIRSDNDINIDGIKLKTGQELDIIAGNDVILTPRILDTYLRRAYFPVEKESEFSRMIDSVGNVIILAHRDIYSKAAIIESKGNIDLIAGRDFLLPGVNYAINITSKVEHNVTDIKAAQKLIVAVNGDLIANGAHFNAGNDMQLSAHGKMEFNSVVNSNKTQLGNTKTASTTQHNVVLSSGGNLNLLSDSSILLQATDLDAHKSIFAAAKGGFLFAQAMQETSFYESKTTKRNWYGRKKTTVKTSNKVVNKVVDFTANDNITLISAEDSTYQASQIKAGKDIKLASTNGKVIFDGVKDSEFNQKIAKSRSFFVKHSDKGYEKETWRLPVIQAGGEFSVDATKGISADIVAQKNKSLQNALTLLGNSDGTKWLKGLDKKDDVQWNKVQDAYASWNYKTQSLNPVIAAVIAIAVAVATSGVGLAAGGSVAGSVGATGMTQTVITNSVAAGFSSLSSKAAISLVENKGNISKTLHDLASKESVKSIATSMIIGGAMAGFDEAFNITPNANPNANISGINGSEKLTLISNGDWGKVAQSVVGHSVINAGINTAMSGGSFKDRFSTALLSNVGNQINAETANFIGHSGYFNNGASKLLPHAITSAIAAEIGGGSGKGAAAGAFAAELAAIALDNTFKSNSSSYNNYYQKMLNLGKLTGAVAGAIVTRSPEGVYSGSNAGYLVVENNYLATIVIQVMKPSQTIAAPVTMTLADYLGLTLSQAEVAIVLNSMTVEEKIALQTRLSDGGLSGQNYVDTLRDKYTNAVQSSDSSSNDNSDSQASAGTQTGSIGGGASLPPDDDNRDKDKADPKGTPPKTLQSGGNTLNQNTADKLNQNLGTNYHRRDWGRALEELKKDFNLRNDHHGKILSNGDYMNGADKIIGNIADYLP